METQGYQLKMKTRIRLVSTRFKSVMKLADMDAPNASKMISKARHKSIFGPKATRRCSVTR